MPRPAGPYRGPGASSRYSGAGARFTGVSYGTRASAAAPTSCGPTGATTSGQGSTEGGPPRSESGHGCLTAYCGRTTWTAFKGPVTSWPYGRPASSSTGCASGLGNTLTYGTGSPDPSSTTDGGCGSAAHTGSYWTGYGPAGWSATGSQTRTGGPTKRGSTGGGRRGLVGEKGASTCDRGTVLGGASPLAVGSHSFPFESTARTFSFTLQPIRMCRRCQ